MGKKTIQVSGFPGLVPANQLKECLEGFTGRDTVVALDVKLEKNGRRAYARVQFTSTRCAERIIELAKNRLYFGRSYLKAYESNMDMIHVRTYAYEMEDVTLNLGCQVSHEKFLALWKKRKVSVKFGTGMKNIHFYLNDCFVEYRLQLSYKCIWQIVHYHPSGQPARLLIQLNGAPRIYKKLNDASVYSFYKDTPDDQWIRTTDFTPSSCIGQSSTLCLELPLDTELPNFKDNFAYYKETKNSISMEDGIPFSPNSSLVPIVQPPCEFDVPYKILFKVCILVQIGCVPLPNLDAGFFRLVDPDRIDIKFIEHALEKLSYLKECCYNPAEWLSGEYEKYRRFEEIPKSPPVRANDGLVQVRRVLVTPSRVYFMGPEINVSNRVLRHFKADIENFLRVSFVDEEWEKMYAIDLSMKATTVGENGRTKLYDRVLSTLKDGIRIGDKNFEFLAFSSSQLRENSLWMFASHQNLNAGDIREWMGDFRSIRNVAKYASRLGQSFGSSKETLTVARHEVEQIPDIKRGTEYIFSDGIGKISTDFAQRVARKCGAKDLVPSAFQIRYGGYKGVVAINPNSSMKLSLRPSMMKYESDNTKLDVLGWSKYQPCFLNRQIITLLSTLGVKDQIFEKMQCKEVDRLNEILVDPVRAAEALDLMSPGENANILKEMLSCGYKPDMEPFLLMMLQTFRSLKLMDLRTKSRVFVRQGRQMMGCLDETGTLEYGQVFIQFSGARRNGHVMDDDHASSNYTSIVRRKVVVAKNPCLHPGDVRVLEAVNVEALHHMVDCIVFPSQGPRPHPNECSGSDLDGDVYFVSWDPDLIPPKQFQPMNYDPAPKATLDHDVTIEEVMEYFTNSILNDSLGTIANAHTVFADKESLMALSEPCIELSKLHSVAVDFAKTGIPAEIRSNLRVKEYPDFMEKRDKTTYESYRVIGKLFREVKDILPHRLRSFTKEVARESYDPDMEYEGFKDYIDEAYECKTEYDYKLGNLMDFYGFKTEGEALSGSSSRVSKTSDRRRDTELAGAAVRSLRSKARSWFKRGLHSDTSHFAKASAWYHVTYHPNYWGSYNMGSKRDHYISFPWCVYDELVCIKKEKMNMANRVRRIGRVRVHSANLTRNGVCQSSSDTSKGD